MSDRIEQLTERIHLMELANDANTDCIMIFDTGLHAVYWNNASEMVTGIPRGEAIGYPYFDLFPAFRQSKEINNALANALKGRRSFVPHDKGSFQPGFHEQRFVPLKNQDDQVVGVLNIIHDVAHRIKVERELKSLNKSLAKKNRDLKSSNTELYSFAHVASHDLNEPLHKTYSYAELILEKEFNNLSEAGKGYFKKIQAMVQRMRLLTDDIATYSRINAEQTEFTDVNLDHVLLLTINEMQDVIRYKSVTVETEYLPVVKGYPTLLLTMFQNLISNAIKFCCRERTPEIKIASLIIEGRDIIYPDVDTSLRYAKISFTDNGIGFDMKKSEHIFQMFYQVNPKLYPGTGIGLTICKKIAALHNGFITVTSIENSGSVFNVFLPLP